MIKRVWGRCNSADIVLSRDGGQWTVTVPGGKGEYIVELYAEDDAGNSGYIATMLLTYDVTKLCATFKVADVAAGYSMADVAAALGPGIEASAWTGAVDVTGGMSEIGVSVSGCEISGGGRWAT